jgi:predicted DNA-binding ribbon-helix-helix protein
VVQTLLQGDDLVRAAHSKRRKSKSSASSRTSVTFPHDLYQNLEEIALKKKVSIAWVIRDATERYVADQWPLFAKAQS